MPGCRHLFFPPIENIEALSDTNRQIIIVEAEKSALALTALAHRNEGTYIVIAVSGCWGWKRKKGNRLLPDGGHETETGPSPDLNLITWTKRQVHIAFDSNVKTNSDVQRARNALAKELATRGAKISFINIPEGPGINGPDDLIAQLGDEAAIHVFNERIPFSADAIPLIVQDLIDFKTTEFPLREPLMILDPHKTVVLTQRSLNQIFAWRGTGKTMVAMALAGAIATGGKFLNLQAARPARVLYVEGETPNAQLQERARNLVGPTEKDFFRVISLENQSNGIPALSESLGRNLLVDALGSSEVLILDSISTLAWMPTNDEDSWLGLLKWFAWLRSQGLCVVILHHAGKSGLQRGHSRSEDMLDVSIKLSKPQDEEEVDWLKLKLEYDKFRGERTGIRSLIVECRANLWSWKMQEDDKLDILRKYLLDYPKAASRTIARDLPELGNHVTVSKLLRQLKPSDE